MTHYPVDLDSLIVKEDRRLKKVKGAVIRKFINIK